MSILSKELDVAVPICYLTRHIAQNIGFTAHKSMQRRFWLNTVTYVRETGTKKYILEDGNFTDPNLEAKILRVFVRHKRHGKVTYKFKHQFRLETVDQLMDIIHELDSKR